MRNNAQNSSYFIPFSIQAEGFKTLLQRGQNSVLEYYPFGLSMTSYKNPDFNYEFDFNGKPTDDETGWQDYGERMYHKGIIRFPSPDPLIVRGQQYPELSPYQFASNTPIQAIDLDGLEAISATTYFTENRGYVLVLQMTNPRGSIRINTFASNSGAWSVPVATGAVDYGSSGRVRGLYGAAVKSSYWTASNTGNSFRRNTIGLGTYSGYRPILWESSNDGIRTNTIIGNETVNVASPIIIIGDVGFSRRVSTDMSFIQGDINSAIQSVNLINASPPPPTTTIATPVNNLVTVINHPDVPGEVIAINQNIQSASQVQINNAGNVVVTITGHTSDANQINAVISGLQADPRNAGVSFRTVITDTYAGGSGGTYQYSVTYEQNTTTTTTTNTTTTATDSSNGQDIPQGN